MALSDEDLDAIEARWRAVETLPWRAERDDDWGIYSPEHGLVLEVRAPDFGDRWPTTWAIRCAPDDIGALVAEVRALRSELADFMWLAVWRDHPRVREVRQAYEERRARGEEPPLDPPDVLTKRLGEEESGAR